jgi:hypothetical protein
VSGELVVKLADQFIATAALMETALETKVITWEQYQTWATFGRKFQKVFPMVVESWQIARATGDKRLEDQMMIIVMDLALQMNEFSERK